ncbi:MAG TPA: histidinol-phosphatase HisJ family protein [Spirochaetia bacterium]|nr:histidinol-phosphatase HisJ family protein [Spirochaetia bacterium]
MLTNYHTHCDFCDGKATAAAMADAARRAGFSILGFSSHAPLPFQTRWNMRMSRLGEYVDSIRGLGRAHGQDMRVLVGLEVDYIEGLCGPADGRFDGAGLDYRIGSVHFVLPDGAPAPSPNALDDDGEPTFGFTVDESEDKLDAHLERFYDGDADAMADDYYAALAACARSGGFDIVGHFDLVRKNNAGQRLFSEAGRRYRDAAMAAVEAVAASGAIVEINTGGMARGKTDSPYPASWILKELRARGVGVCLNADAHEPRHLSAHRDDGLRAAAAAGYDRLTVISPDGRFECELG